MLLQTVEPRSALRSVCFLTAASHPRAGAGPPPEVGTPQGGLDLGTMGNQIFLHICCVYCMITGPEGIQRRAMMTPCLCAQPSC